MKIPAPRGSARLVKDAVLAAEALHRVALANVRARFEEALDPRARLVAEVDRLKELVAIRDEELRILRSRIAERPPRERPHYPPQERFAILSLRARTGWNLAEVARRFLVTATTIAGWIRRLNEGGKDALVKPRSPVNRHSDRVALLVKRLHVLAPQLGKRKAADILARAGLKLAASTVARLKKRKLGPPSNPPPKHVKSVQTSPTRVVRAKYPHHLWHVDITTISTGGGISLPFSPWALFNLWPFTWHVAVVVDHFSRSLVAFAVCKKEPTGRDVCRLLDRARAAAGKTPRHIVTDRGTQFGVDYLGWCETHHVKSRFGAIGKHGSIAVVERFIRSLKQEHLRRVLVPFGKKKLEKQLDAYRRWFNDHRPHMTLAGRTPREKIRQRPQVVTRLEPRARFPIPAGEKRVQRCDDINLFVQALDGHRHLPVIELRTNV